MTIEEIFGRMKDNFKAEKASGVNMTIQFDLSGDESGTWNVAVADGDCSVNKGPADDPTATINMTSEDYKAMTTGKLNPMTAFMSGKIKVSGDLASVMKFQEIFPV
ncbi:MAG TPA: SCP2 sterol-binding domain-containing protein [Anaerolineae bacterium]|nr:SCP2 sterol-binding domain-containing protein [Anaerolineae bacterium]